MFLNEYLFSCGGLEIAGRYVRRYGEIIQFLAHYIGTRQVADLILLVQRIHSHP